MMDLFKSAVLLLTTPKCYDEYFVNFNFFHGECMKITISKVLGFIIIAGSVAVKVPQIMKIIKNKSGEGISLIGAILDICAITSFFLYSYLKKFPFSAWGEGLFLAVQTFAVIGLILYFNNQFPELTVFSAIYSTLVLLVLAKVIPFSVVWMMQMLNFPIIILGKAPWLPVFGFVPNGLCGLVEIKKGIQALTNYRSQSTGQLSAITCWMQFGGSAARVFTSVQETGDVSVIVIFVVTSLLNGIIAFQVLYYARSSQKRAESRGKTKSKKSD